jgi:hypothetical protein
VAQRLACIWHPKHHQHQHCGAVELKREQTSRAKSPRREKALHAKHAGLFDMEAKSHQQQESEGFGAETD